MGPSPHDCADLPLYRKVISVLDAVFIRLIGAVHLQMEYTVPMEQLREQFRIVLESSSLWDVKIMTVQVTDAKGNTTEIRF